MTIITNEGSISMTTLDAIQSKKTVTVKSLRKLDVAYKQQLQTMGLTPGANITVVRRAPLGDPIQIHVNNTSLSLRQREAAAIEVIEL
jgi:ferrous iron transport protein A